jgi:hypothetical protein
MITVEADFSKESDAPTDLIEPLRRFSIQDFGDKGAHEHAHQ